MGDFDFMIKYPPVASGVVGATSLVFHEGEFDATDVMKDSDDSDLNNAAPKFFVVDSEVAKLPVLSKLVDATSAHPNNLILRIPAGEKNKNMKTVSQILTTAMEYNFTRKCAFVAIGGGVACDLVAFAASIYKRGVQVHFVPTTLLCMVDAAIGGKCGCDVGCYKNMAGSFWAASKIDYYPAFVKTLSDSQYKSGLAEAIKTALLFNNAMVSTFLDNSERVLDRNDALLGGIITDCAKAKAAICEKDFTEQGDRKFLNLGHTFAHALEAISGLKISHGEAVAWGIGRAAVLSKNLGVCNSGYVDIIHSLLARYGYDCTATAGFTDKDFANRVIKVMHTDKKNTSGLVTLVLQKDICNTLALEVDDSAIKQVLQ